MKNINRFNSILIWIILLGNSSLYAQSIKYSYDNLGRVTNTLYQDSSNISYTYDAMGNRTTATTLSPCDNKAKPHVSASNTNICAGQSSTLTGTGAVSYTWSPSTGLNATTGSIVTANPTITTTYTLNTINSIGCLYSQTITINLSCGVPTTIFVSNLTNSTSTINWTGNSCAVKFRLQYRKQGILTWTTKIIIAPTAFYNLTGLTPNTTYEYHLRSDCNSNGTVNSGWSTTQTFTTPLRLEETNTESVIPEFTVNPNPCTTCEIIGEINPDDLVITDIIGRTVAADFNKTSNGYSINFMNDATGFFIIRSRKTGQVVKFVKE